MSKTTFSAQYTAAIKDVVKNLPVHAEINSFLFDVWVEVLVLSAMRYGPDHINTLVLKKIVMDLVWAGEAKRTRRSRGRTMMETPPLMDKIRDGMNLIGLSVVQQAAHVERISGPLLDAFFAIETPASPLPPSVPSPPLRETPPPPATKAQQTYPSISTPDLDVTEKQTDSVWSLFEGVTKGPPQR
jgi:hypothetical protein